MRRFSVSPVLRFACILVPPVSYHRPRFSDSPFPRFSDSRWRCFSDSPVPRFPDAPVLRNPVIYGRMGAQGWPR